MLLFTYDYVHHTLDSNCSFFFFDSSVFPVAPNWGNKAKL